MGAIFYPQRGVQGNWDGRFISSQFRPHGGGPQRHPDETHEGSLVLAHMSPERIMSMFGVFVLHVRDSILT